MKKLMSKTLICSAAAAGLFLVAQAADAAMSGACVTCHTMHNSQDGAAMTSGTGTAAQGYLLRAANSCIGCHSGPGNQLKNEFNAPIVVHTSQPTTIATDGSGAAGTIPAGGSFYWVSSAGGDDDARGHNVSGVADEDAQLHNTPPGSDSGSLSAMLTCEGCHVGGGHHYNAGNGTWIDGSNVPAESYRFLSPGVAGLEDTDWEWTVTSSDHNVYNANANNTTLGSDTIQEFCAECHGRFHGSYNAGTDAGAGTQTAWRRHPTDYSLPETGEYAAYNTYNPIAPVGNSSDTATFTTLADGKDIVLCVSCHRVHGSPFDDLLRWSYGTMDAGGSSATGGVGIKGCFICHTTK